MEAALEGAREIGFTIVSMTASLAAVFLPVLFMGGIVGRLLHEFAVVIGAAVIVSGFVSLTLTPMLCSRFLRPPREAHGRVYAASERVFTGMLAAYERSLQPRAAAPALHPRRSSSPPLVLTGYLFVIIPKGFIPNEDTGQIFAFTEAAQDISFEGMMEHQLKAAGIVRPAAVRRRRSSPAIGASGSSVVMNTGRIFMRLKPTSERPTADEIVKDLRQKLARHPGHQRLSAGAADDPDRRPAHQGPVPVHAPGRRSADPLPLGPDPVRADARACPASSTSTRTCRSRARRCWSRSTARRPPRSG